MVLPTSPSWWMTWTLTPPHFRPSLVGLHPQTLTQSLAYSNFLSQSIDHLFIQSLSINRSLIQSLFRSIDHLFNHSFDQSITYSISLSITHSRIQSLSRSITCLFNLFLDQSLVYSISLSITRSLSPSENTLLAGEDMAQSLRSLSEKKLLNSYRLVSKIESTMNKFLIGYQHVRTHIPSEHHAGSFPGVLEGVELVMWWGVCVA